jgi:hypothetical protein
MVVMVTMVVVHWGSERRSGKHHQKQYGCENLFHGINVARTLPKWVESRYHRIKSATPVRNRPSRCGSSVNLNHDDIPG